MDLNIQSYTDGSSTKEDPALLLMIIYKGINNYSLHKNRKNYIEINIDKLIIANIILT